MTKRVGILIATVMLAGRLGAQVASGGAFVLDRSLMAAGHQLATGGSYSLSSAIGDGVMPITRSAPYTKAATKRIYTGFLESMMIDPSVINTLSLDNGNVHISIPAGVIPQPYEALVESMPTLYPIASELTIVERAVLQLEAGFGSYAEMPLAAIELRFLMEDGTLFTGALGSSVEFGLAYNDRGDGGEVHVFVLDEAGQQWMSLPGGVFSLSANLARFFQSGAGIFAVYQAGPTDVTRSYVFPVPWRPNGGNPDLYGTLAQGITFSGIPSSGLISIYDIAGELVREIVIPTGVPQLQWDGRTAGGSNVASGVYIWVVDSDGNKKKGKLMIIR